MKRQQTVTQSKSSVVFLRGKTTILRPVSLKDIPLFTKWINDPEIRQFIMNIFPITEGSEKEWVENLNKKSDKDIVLVIEVRGKPIGIMGIHGIDWRDRIATTGAIIGEVKYQGKGYGTDAKMTLLNYVFNTLNLRKIMSRVKSFNKRSLAYSLHCGYKVEGRLRKQHFVNGKYYDEIVLGLFRHEWLPYWEAHCKNG
jgi:RimJ/RimL family protein N-acetyltransferase